MCASCLLASRIVLQVAMASDVICSILIDLFYKDYSKVLVLHKQTVGLLRSFSDFRFPILIFPFPLMIVMSSRLVN